ncbi:MAG: hypothetical protein WHW07_01320 [Bacteroidales bacterium]|jgi:hypothetical protein
MELRKIRISAFLVLAFASIVKSQVADSSINILQCEINYSFHLPAGDLANRFGFSSMIGAGVNFKHKSNFMIGGECSYLFGPIVKGWESILEGIMTQSGNIINRYGEYGTIALSERGFYAGVKTGYLFNIFNPNPNSGIFFNLSSGILQHKIHIENKDNNTPPVLGDYKKGYDRLSNGLAFKEFIGYQYLDNKRMINFYFGLEFYQAFTKNRRDYNFDTMSRDDNLYKDYLFGIRAGWILPLYKRSPQKFYYY